MSVMMTLLTVRKLASLPPESSVLLVQGFSLATGRPHALQLGQFSCTLSSHSNVAPLDHAKMPTEQDVYGWSR